MWDKQSNAAWRVYSTSVSTSNVFWPNLLGYKGKNRTYRRAYLILIVDKTYKMCKTSIVRPILVNTWVGEKDVTGKRSGRLCKSQSNR